MRFINISSSVVHKRYVVHKPICINFQNFTNNIFMNNVNILLLIIFCSFPRSGAGAEIIFPEHNNYAGLS